jgi:hypothetical protein
MKKLLLLFTVIVMSTITVASEADSLYTLKLMSMSYMCKASVYEVNNEKKDLIKQFKGNPKKFSVELNSKKDYYIEIKRIGKVKIFIKGSNEKLVINIFYINAQTNVVILPFYRKYKAEIINGYFKVEQIYN